MINIKNENKFLKNETNSRQSNRRKFKNKITVAASYVLTVDCVFLSSCFSLMNK